MLELLDRIPVEGLGNLFVCVRQVIEERRHPVAPVLDRGHTQIGESGEDAVAAEGSHGVLDRALPNGHEAERVEAEGQHLARSGPVTLVTRVATVRGVHAHEDVRIDDGLPERIELGESERARALGTPGPVPAG